MLLLTPTTWPRSPSQMLAAMLASDSITAQCTPPCMMPAGLVQRGRHLPLRTNAVRGQFGELEAERLAEALVEECVDLGGIRPVPQHECVLCLTRHDLLHRFWWGTEPRGARPTRLPNMYLVIVIHRRRRHALDPPERRTGGFRAICAEPAVEGTGSHCSPQDSGTVQQY